MDVSMRRSRQRWGNGGESRDFSWPEKVYISDRHRSNAAPSTTFCTLSTARRRSSTHHERFHHGTPRDPPTPSFSAPLTLPRRINIPPLSHRHFGSLARRLGRIFAHAYFHHREVFEQAEAESSLYARFLALTCKFDLVPPEFLIIPTRSSLSDDPEPPRLLAAAVDPLHQSGSDDENDDRGRGTHRGLGMDILGGVDRNPSPRKVRNRTGTMVSSEALIMAEELGKRGGSPGPESDSVVHLSPASTEMPESEGGFVHVDVSSREAEVEETRMNGITMTVTWICQRRRLLARTNWNIWMETTWRETTWPPSLICTRT